MSCALTVVGACILAFLVIALAVELDNARVLLRRRLGRYPATAARPRVSVLVPARNEEPNIESNIRSLLAQDYPDFEIIALDDNSTDQTAAILDRLAAGHPALTAIRGAPLPVGWYGKHWACRQLAERASGELLLFTDADTRHHPLALADAVRALSSEQADFLTALPHQETGTLAERLVIPLMPMSILGFLPLEIARRAARPGLVAACGPFMLFRRAAFDAVGGFDAIREEPVDDMALARRVVAQGLRWVLVDGQDRVSCRMYHNAREVFRGAVKSLYGAIGFGAPLYAAFWMWFLLAFWEPLVVLGLVAAGNALPAPVTALAAAAVALSCALWGIGCRYFRFPLVLAGAYPFAIGFAASAGLYSMIAMSSGRAVWKDRRLSIAGSEHVRLPR